MSKHQNSDGIQPNPTGAFGGSGARESINKALIKAYKGSGSLWNSFEVL
jgi:hypothetical protein